MKTEDYLDYNKKFWNERVSIHKESEFYELKNFKFGKNKLHRKGVSKAHAHGTAMWL